MEDLNKHNCGCQDPCTDTKPCKCHDSKPCKCHEEKPCDCGCHKHHHECKSIFPENYHLIKTSCELKQELSEVFMRFDTDPSFYTKEDYRVFLRVLAQALIYLYYRDRNSAVVYKVKELPQCSEFGAIYVVPKEDGEEGDKYTEYLGLGSDRFELIGGEGSGECDFAGIESGSKYIEVSQDPETQVWYVGLTDEAVELIDEISELSEKVIALDRRITTDEGLIHTNTTKISELDTRVNTLERRKIYTKLPGMAAVEVPLVNNAYTINLPEGCKCTNKFTEVHESKYNIGGISVGDKFGPGIAGHETFEDFVHQLLCVKEEKNPKYYIGWMSPKALGITRDPEDDGIAEEMLTEDGYSFFYNQFVGKLPDNWDSVENKLVFTEDILRFFSSNPQIWPDGCPSPSFYSGELSGDVVNVPDVDQQVVIDAVGEGTAMLFFMCPNSWEGSAQSTTTGAEQLLPNYRFEVKGIGEDPTLTYSVYWIQNFNLRSTSKFKNVKFTKK